jgi:hypothetical protein
VDSVGSFGLAVTAHNPQLFICRLFPSPVLVATVSLSPVPVAGLAATAFSNGSVKFAVVQQHPATDGGGELVTGVLDSRLRTEGSAAADRLDQMAAVLRLQRARLPETPAAVCITCESLVAVFSLRKGMVALYDWNISTKNLMASFMFPAGFSGPCHVQTMLGGQVVVTYVVLFFGSLFLLLSLVLTAWRPGQWGINRMAGWIRWARCGRFWPLNFPSVGSSQQAQPCCCRAKAVAVCLGWPPRPMAPIWPCAAPQAP